MRNVSHKVVQNIKILISCSITFFFQKSRRLWENVEKCFTAGHPIKDNIPYAHWILDTNAKNTISVYVILIDFPLQQWLDECVLRGVIRPLAVWLTSAPKEQSGQIYVTAALPTRQELMETVKGSQSPGADLEAFEKTNISHPCRNRLTIPW